jgi:membrane protease YdiL (CAAX protease family)
MPTGEAPDQGESPLGLAAGGTLVRQPLTPLGRVWRATEMAVLFIAAPLAMHFAVHQARTPLFVALLPVLLVVLVILAFDRSFSLRREAARGIGWRTLLSILVVFAAGTAGVAAWLQDTHPSWLFEFPRNRPELWLMILLAYPFASVAAQEIVYRTFFFHRYGPLFGTWTGAAILLNGVLFGFGHIVVGQPFAIAATTLSGLLFAARYVETRSFWAVFLEHTLWGAMVFTIGLGRYFFTGVSNV